ncbi:EamA/RhaT family transporter [Campylobacter sp. MIT 99-7217]|uniref:DMT family transporter n=1 Tax=Campylobacter sp. MIT 99-7217 TaxID=535091 RepID=UPI00115A3505|nr:EamA/RhaT family transporter [Campylobacter sp. MIT 99-7217]
MKQGYLYTLLVLSMFFWGTSWPLSKILTYYPQGFDIICFWRFVFVVLGSLGVVLIFKISLKLDKSIIKYIVIAGLLNALYTLIFFIAIAHGFAGKGGVLVTTMIPIFSYLLFILALKLKHKKIKENINKTEFFGLFLGLCSGLCLLELDSLSTLFGKFNVLFLLCALIWACMTIFTHKTKGANPLAVNFYINAVSLIIFAPILLLPNTFEVFNNDGTFWLSLIAVTFLSTVVGTSIYYFGIHKLGSIKANSFILITPASALISSYFILDEIPTLLTLLGCVLAICAIYCINIYSKKGKKV